MQLVSPDGFIADPWRRLDGDGVEDAEIPHDGDVIIPHRRLAELTGGKPRSGRTGLHIGNDASAHALHNLLPKLELISIAFPVTGDGRGFSLARQLRAMGFMGQLRAKGPLIADQFAFALSCGFDTVEIPLDLAARQPQVQWLAAAGEIGPGFQTGYPTGVDVLRQRHGHLTG